MLGMMDESGGRKKEEMKGRKQCVIILKVHFA
jgi:hypothetical protein